MSSYVHIDNKEKDILISGQGPPPGLNDTTFKVEEQYPINFTVSYSLMLQKYINSKQKTLKEKITHCV